MTVIWRTVEDDRLEMADQAAAFLQGEFCPDGADPMWSGDYLRWKLGPANPAGPGFMSLALADGQVVGTVTLNWKRILLDGLEYAGGEVGDTYSAAGVRRNSRPAELSSRDGDPASYINKSIFGRLASDVRSRAEQQGVALIYGTPNQNAYSGWVNRLGYFDLKEYRNKSFTRPTAAFFANRFPGVPGLAFAARIAEQTFLALQTGACRTLRGVGLTVERACPGAAELEELWSRCRPLRGFSLVRDARHWQYRYLAHPLLKYDFFSVRKAGQLVGVLAVRLARLSGGRKALFVAEWMLEPEVKLTYPLCVIVGAYLDEGVELFNCWARQGGQDAHAARFNLFLARNRVPVIFAETPLAQNLRGCAEQMVFHLGSADAV